MLPKFLICLVTGQSNKTFFCAFSRKVTYSSLSFAGQTLVLFYFTCLTFLIISCADLMLLIHLFLNVLSIFINSTALLTFLLIFSKCLGCTVKRLVFLSIFFLFLWNTMLFPIKDVLKKSNFYNFWGSLFKIRIIATPPISCHFKVLILVQFWLLIHSSWKKENVRNFSFINCKYKSQWSLVSLWSMVITQPIICVF